MLEASLCSSTSCDVDRCHSMKHPLTPPGFRSSTCLVLRELKRFNFWLINDDSLNFSNHWTPLIQSQHLDGNWLLCYHPLVPHKNWMGYCWKLCCLAMIVSHDATWQVVFFALKTIMPISTVYTAISSPLFLKINNVALLTLFFQIVYTDDSAAQDCSGLDWTRLDLVQFPCLKAV